jgi:8-oxo-dGTP diphosphatase
VLRRLLALGPDWVRTAWWGLRARGRAPVAVVQGAVLRGEAGRCELLLALRPDVRGWELPGGHLEAGEGPEQALAREIREETGLHVEVAEPIGVYRRTGFLPHTATVYRCVVRGGESAPGPEAVRVVWWPTQCLPATLLPWFEVPVADVLAHRAGAPPVSRVERNGLERILRAAAVDLRMRLSGDRAR